MYGVCAGVLCKLYVLSAMHVSYVFVYCVLYMLCELDGLCLLSVLCATCVMHMSYVQCDV